MHDTPHPTPHPRTHRHKNTLSKPLMVTHFFPACLGVCDRGCVDRESESSGGFHGRCGHVPPRQVYLDVFAQLRLSSFAFLSDHFEASCFCITDTVSRIQYRIQRDTRQDGLSLSSPHVCPSPPADSVIW